MAAQRAWSRWRSVAALALLILTTPAAQVQSGGEMRSGVLWARAGAASADVAGTVLLECVQTDAPACGQGSRATRLPGSGKYTVFTYAPLGQPVFRALWRDANSTGQIDAGDDLTLMPESPQARLQLTAYDGNWRRVLGEKVLDDLYSSNTLGTVPTSGPLPALAALPVQTPAGPPSTAGARGSLSGSWLLYDGYPALPPTRGWNTPASLRRDDRWPLQVLAFQNQFQGRYLYTADLPGDPPGNPGAGCGPGSTVSIKLEGQFATAEGTLTFRDTGRTRTTSCRRPEAQETATPQAKATCATAAATLSAEQRAAYLPQCLSALSGSTDAARSVQKLPLETHRYRYRRYELQLSSDERGSRNDLLVLEDAQGHVYLYRKS